MSLLGVATRTPRVPTARPPRAGVAVLPRVDRGRDNVALHYSLPVDGRADDAGDGLVGIDGIDLDLAEVIGPGLGAEDVQFLADGQAVAGPDRDLHRAAGGVQLDDLALDGVGDDRAGVE